MGHTGVEGHMGHAARDGDEKGAGQRYQYFMRLGYLHIKGRPRDKRL